MEFIQLIGVHKQILCLVQD